MVMDEAARHSRLETRVDGRLSSVSCRLQPSAWSGCRQRPAGLVEAHVSHVVWPSGSLAFVCVGLCLQCLWWSISMAPPFPYRSRQISGGPLARAGARGVPVPACLLASALQGPGGGV